MKRDKAFLTMFAIAVLLFVPFVGLSIVAENGREQALERLKLSQVSEFSKSYPSTNQNSEEHEANERVELYEEMCEELDELDENSEWQNLLELIEAKSPAEWSEEEYANLEALLKSKQDLINDIHELVYRGKSFIQFESLEDIPLEEYSVRSKKEANQNERVRNCARLLLINAISLSRKGNTKESVNELTLCLKLGNMLAPQPTLLSQLVRIAVTGITFDGYRDSIESDTIHKEETERLLAVISKSSNRKAFVNSVKSEMRIGIVEIDDMWTDFLKQPKFFLAKPLVEPMHDWNIKSYIETIEKCIEAMQLPYDEAEPLIAQIIQNAKEPSLIRHFTLPVSEMLLDPILRSFPAQIRHESILGLLQTGITLEAYYVEHGAYPADLDEIMQITGEKLPLDPFTGKAFRYESNGDSFLLYSLGQNQTDEGGTHDYKTGDIVWRGRIAHDTEENPD